MLYTSHIQSWLKLWNTSRLRAVWIWDAASLPWKDGVFWKTWNYTKIHNTVKIVGKLEYKYWVGPVSQY